MGESTEAPAAPAAQSSGKRLTQVVKTGSGVTVMSAEDWAQTYPEIYASYLANSENSEVHDYTKDYPMIGVLYEGMAFSKCYSSARGHTYTVEDVTSTGRPHALANCFSCKTPDYPAMVNEMGDAAYRLAFDDVLAQVNEPISCYNCHANTGDELVITHTYLADALGEELKDVDAVTLSCGQWESWTSMIPSKLWSGQAFPAVSAAFLLVKFWQVRSTPPAVWWIPMPMTSAAPPLPKTSATINTPIWTEWPLSTTTRAFMWATATTRPTMQETKRATAGLSSTPSATV